MKIVYFYQYFSTPKGSWGTRVYEFAKNWVELGHEVTVVTSVYSKSDLRATKLIEVQYFEGIRVIIINVGIDNKQSFIRRIWTFVVYSVLSIFYAIKLPADVVIASSGPITVGIPGLVAKYIRRRKLIFETRDLWPLVPIEVGALKNSLMKRIAFWLEKRCYLASSYIVTLSPGMSKNIKDRFGLVNVGDVTNAANIELFATKKEFDSIKGLKHKSYAIYTGNIGLVNNSEWVFNAAKILKEMGRSDISILMIGEGQQRAELEEKAKEYGIDNYLSIGLMAKENLIGYIQNAFVSLVPLKGAPILNTSSPNKFFESLAAGVPVIQNTQGWLKDFIEEHKVGETIDPNDPKALAEKLIFLKDNPSFFHEMGENAKRVAEEFFNQKYLSEKMLYILLKVHENTI